MVYRIQRGKSGYTKNMGNTEYIRAGYIRAECTKAKYVKLECIESE